MKKLKVYLRLIRPHQWVKNLLVAVPAVTTQSLIDESVPPKLLVAFVAFSLLSSSVYILNDFVDREYDRAHATKRSRPIASRAVSIRVALWISLSLASVAFWLSSLLGPEFLAAAISYSAASVLYTMVVKKVAIADVVLLATMYSLRVLAGGISIDAKVSFWLLAFSFFFFLSLAFVKRTTELLKRPTKSGGTPGRGYFAADTPMIQGLGVSSAMVSVLVFALYLESDDVRIVFDDPRALWFCVPLLVFWFSRLWLKTQRGEVSEDPVLFAIRDKVSIAVGLLLTGLFVIPQFIY